MKVYKNLIRFLIYVLVLCLSWFILYDIWLSSFDDWLTLRIADASVWFLTILGYEAETRISSVFIDGNELVYIGPACNGMVLMALFAGFIIAFPGPTIKKLYFIPLGIVIINLLNVLRIAFLSLNALYSHQT
jgi:exosortase/archaeosortase